MARLAGRTQSTSVIVLIRGVCFPGEGGGRAFSSLRTALSGPAFLGHTCSWLRSLPRGHLRRISQVSCSQSSQPWKGGLFPTSVGDGGWLSGQPGRGLSGPPSPPSRPSQVQPGSRPAPALEAATSISVVGGRHRCGPGISKVGSVPQVCARACTHGQATDPSAPPPSWATVWGEQ